MTYIALTYSFSYLEPVCCPMSSSNCCFLTCTQISQEACQVVWYSHLFKDFPQLTILQYKIKSWKTFLSVYAGCSGIPSWYSSRNNLSYQNPLMRAKTKRNTDCLIERFHNQASLISLQDSEGRDVLQPLGPLRLFKTTRANLITYSVPESFLLPPWDGDRALKLSCGINVTHLSKATP